MTDADKKINPLHFWERSGRWAIQIPIRINLEIRIRIPDHFHLALDALAEVRAVRAHSSIDFQLTEKSYTLI